MGFTSQEEISLTKHLDSQQLGSVPGRQGDNTVLQTVIEDLQRQLREQCELNKTKEDASKKSLECANAGRINALKAVNVRYFSYEARITVQSKQAQSCLVEGN